MSDRYITSFVSNKRSMTEVADHIEEDLRGVSPDRIVSITHAAALGEGPPATMFYSALIVLKAKDEAAPDASGAA